MASAPNNVAFADASPTAAEQLDKLRDGEAEMRERWRKDEDGWRNLPARAWPKFQPKVDKIEMLRALLDECRKQTPHSSACTHYMFDLATALIFNHWDPEEGLELYRTLAEKGHLEAQVGAGVVLIGGLGVPEDAREGLALVRAACEAGSAQGQYEYATLLYTGEDGLVEEDVPAAFGKFDLAARQGHTCGEFMVADLLLEGEGCSRDAARAVPLLYLSAEKGHRSARRRLLDIMDGRWVAADGFKVPLS